MDTMMDNLTPEPTDEIPGDPNAELEIPGDADLPVDGGGDTAENPDGEGNADPEPTVKIIRDGKEEEIPLSEAANGYMRQADYSRKTEEVARQRAEVEATQQHVQQELANRVNQLGTLSQALYAELVGDQQALNALTDNPTAYLQKQQEMSRKGALLTQVQQAMEAQRQAQTQEAQKLRDVRLQRASEEVARALPEWNDPDKRMAIQKDAAETMMSLGFRPEEMNLEDSRLLLGLHELSMLRRQLGMKGKKAPPAIKRPVTGSNGKPDSSQLARAKERYKAHPDSIEALGDLGAAAGSL